MKLKLQIAVIVGVLSAFWNRATTPGAIALGNTRPPGNQPPAGSPPAASTKSEAEQLEAANAEIAVLKSELAAAQAKQNEGAAARELANRDNRDAAVRQRMARGLSLEQAETVVKRIPMFKEHLLKLRASQQATREKRAGKGAK